MSAKAVGGRGEVNENTRLLIEHLGEGTLARELVELLRDRDPASWADTIRTALQDRVSGEVTRIRNAEDTVD